MIEYMRIAKSKFWAWVGCSVALGFIIGAGLMIVLGNASATKQINVLKLQATEQANQNKAQVDELSARLASSEASLTALNERYAKLTAEKSKAKVETDTAAASSTTSLTVTSRSVVPDSVGASDTITLTAKVKGSPDKVTMRITAKSGSYDQTITLKKTSTSGSTQTWKRTIRAPKTKGTYRYYATASKDGKSVTMPGATPSTFVVE
jgi:uncharacterized membrane-anchored protein YhcB (DUF1043 family)